MLNESGQKVNMQSLKMTSVGLALTMLVAGHARAQFPRSPVDPASAEAGAAIYAKSCAKCHGDDTRGTTGVPDLLRSTVVFHDRREMLHGKDLGPYLKTMPPHQFNYNEKQLSDLSQFLTQSVNKILRSGYDSRPTDLLMGDAKAGEAYFNGAGGCVKCHSTTGDLAGVGTRYAPAALQQKFLFPAAALGLKTKIQLTVTTAAGKSYTGDLVRLDDFTATLRDKDGETRSFNRTPTLKVKTEDPFAGHNDLLGRYTDADIHNLTTYLDTLK